MLVPYSKNHSTHRKQSSTITNLKTNTMKDTTISDMGILISEISISFYMPAILRHNLYL
nr:MAG TPA: hypothetical protein [Caudoviricetes sp.]